MFYNLKPAVNWYSAHFAFLMCQLWNSYTTQERGYIYLVEKVGVMVIVAGNGHGDMSSNPGQDWLDFTWH